MVLLETTATSQCHVVWVNKKIGKKKNTVVYDHQTGAHHYNFFYVTVLHQLQILLTGLGLIIVVIG
jgi:uncharacterized protein (DUF1015 family)